jgi:hypothetical protein
MWLLSPYYCRECGVAWTAPEQEQRLCVRRRRLALFKLLKLVAMLCLLAPLGCGPDLSDMISPHVEHRDDFVHLYGAGCGLRPSVVEANYSDTKYLNGLCRLPSGQWLLKSKAQAWQGNVVYDGPVEGMGVIGVGGSRPDWHDVLYEPNWHDKWSWYHGINYVFPVTGGEARPVTGVLGNRYIISACGSDDLGFWVTGVEIWGR